LQARCPAVKFRNGLDQNSPQKAPNGLYAEQLSGCAFTVARKNQQLSWLYRIKPSVCHAPFEQIASQNIVQDFSRTDQCEITPNQLRWSPFPFPQQKIDFTQGLQSICGQGSPAARDGIAIYNYACNANMENKAMYNSDGDFLIVPQDGYNTAKW
jgi:homogentisate 1,2-dioxygenase